MEVRGRREQPRNGGDFLANNGSVTNLRPCTATCSRCATNRVRSPEQRRRGNLLLYTVQICLEADRVRGSIGEILDWLDHRGIERPAFKYTIRAEGTLLRLDFRSLPTGAEFAEMFGGRILGLAREPFLNYPQSANAGLSSRSGVRARWCKIIHLCRLLRSRYAEMPAGLRRAAIPSATSRFGTEAQQAAKSPVSIA